MYGVVGTAVYFIDTNWAWHLLGTMVNNRTNPVSMSDNGTNAVIVDGSSMGYAINLQSNSFSGLSDPTGTFAGSNRTDFSDTYLGFATPGTNAWTVSLSNQVAFNALAQANKDTSPDPIQTFAFNLRQGWLLGTKNTEIWYLSGGTPFPYSAWPNVLVPYGCAAVYSLVQADIDLFWISTNAQGQAIAIKSKGYGVEAFSTRALEYEWSTYSTVADVVGGTFQLSGHTFIVFHFPTADKTWAFDLATKQWHRRTYIDTNGVVHREKTAFYTSVGQIGGYPKTIVGQDWQTGQIYALDPTYYLDATQPIVFRRSFPHVMKDMHEITHASFVADFETGGISGSAEGLSGLVPDAFNSDFNSDFGPIGFQSSSAPQLCMRYSNNGGASYGNYRQKGLLTSGKYRSMMRWRGLGMARDRVYELMWSYPGPCALQGAYLDPIEHGS